MNKLTCLFICCLLPVVTCAQGLTELEYFFGTDTGVGTGPSSTFTVPLDSINSQASIVTTSLGPGFHELHYRVKDSNGVYSLYQTATFHINAANQQGTSAGISSVEYFFDSDPGVGNGPSSNLGTPTDTMTSGSSLSLIHI